MVPVLRDEASVVRGPFDANIEAEYVDDCGQPFNPDSVARYLIAALGARF